MVYVNTLTVLGRRSAVGSVRILSVEANSSGRMARSSV
jgi:hypothetical protein